MGLLMLCRCCAGTALTQLRPGVTLTGPSAVCCYVRFTKIPYRCHIAAYATLAQFLAFRLCVPIS